MSFAETLIKSPHRGKWNGSDLVLSRDRVQEHGEVLTPSHIVSDMLDLVGNKYEQKLGQIEGTLPIDKTFFEPSCGTGNFLVQILERKLRLCKSREDIFTAVASIYGVDIQKDNVLESRLRMLELIESIEPDEKFLTIIADVLEKNIIGGNTLTDKRGCMIANTWVKGTVRNSTGTVEDDGISHDRLVAYSWKWGSPIEKKVEFLIEEKDIEIKQPVKLQSTEDLMAKFKSLF